MPPSISFSAESWRELRALSEKSYPFEGCGLLVGPLSAGEKVVTKILELRNALRDEGRGRFDFSFSADEFMRAQMSAEKENLDVVGIYHTHPDHPPRPSKTDESQPMLAGWVNVIASVHGGNFKQAKAWWREDDQSAFVETKLELPVI